MKPLTHFLLGWCVNSAAASVPGPLQLRSQQQQQQPIFSGAEGGASTTTSRSAPAYREKLLSLHKSLVDIPSISGAETDAAEFLAGYLEKQGYQVRLQEVPPLDPNNTSTPDAATKRYNVIAWPHLEYPHLPRVLVTSHIDVVPPYIPYSIDSSSAHDVSSDTLIRGRGSVDAKGSVAAQVVAVEELIASGAVRSHDMVLLYVVGEETRGDGMKHFSRSTDVGGRFEAAVFGEPTENKLACGHKGSGGGTVRARGKAGHSGYPELGKSATELLVRALVRIVDADLGSSERYGNTTVNIGTLEGGVAANVIPAHASARLAIRVAVGNQTTGSGIVRKRVEQILRDTDPDAFTLDWSEGYGPIRCDCDVEGFETFVANYGTDVPNLVGNNVNYLYGPGSILVAHGDNEGLRVRDLEEAVEGYKKLILHILRD
ncbi:hypothetical protein B0T26DRAFT_348412 [Lasiosphaeria miniovina]|uniref:Peptidase M20 dimerisation domain-containing protein n=1 Tax=Lasiosphaeria miniovina TaxID=1954250 RepID=A0AA40ABR0_9PEZI|nr:uncharacterized protein B0T26DRAFT_348412 [Lasiosphaeria miniovina]KAK0712892.1 hypothetical protein B0T26DRAFT_348412 [Lasiosphaeria miniovina]